MMKIAPGVLWLKVPVPFPVKFVNLYLLSGKGRYALVDCGPKASEVMECLKDKLPFSSIDYLVITHHHLDHYGMAGEIKRLSKAKVIMSEKEALCADRYFGPVRDDSLSEELFRRNGMPANELESLKEQRSKGISLVSYAPADIKVGEESRLPEEFAGWRIIIAPGHSPGHLCLYREEDEILISGDHLLMEITPNVALSVNSSSDPLSDYLSSLKRSMSLKTKLVLPAHGPLFEDGPSRAREIYEHHQLRKSALLALIESQGLSAYQLSLRLFPEELNALERWFAFSETMAHLENLCNEGLLKKRESQGVVLYQRPL